MVKKKSSLKIHSFFFLWKVKSCEIFQFKSSHNILDFYQKFCSNRYGSKMEVVIIQTYIASVYVMISNLSSKGLFCISSSPFTRMVVEIISCYKTHAILYPLDIFFHHVCMIWTYFSIILKKKQLIKVTQVSTIVQPILKHL